MVAESEADVAEMARQLAETGRRIDPVLEELLPRGRDDHLSEAVWHILSNICNAGWSVGCMASTSPVAAEGGDALWALHTPTGAAISLLQATISPSRWTPKIVPEMYR